MEDFGEFDTHRVRGTGKGRLYDELVWIDGGTSVENVGKGYEDKGYKLYEVVMEEKDEPKMQITDQR